MYGYDFNIIVTGGVGFLASVVSGWVSWFFTRKKYNSEVDNNLIVNMKESLDFYRLLSDDNKLRLDEMLKRNDELEDEIKELRKLVTALMLTTCKDLTCKLRQTKFNLSGEQTK